MRSLPLEEKRRKHVQWEVERAASKQVRVALGVQALRSSVRQLRVCSLPGCLHTLIPPTPAVLPLLQVGVEVVRQGSPHQLLLTKTKAAWEAQQAEGRSLWEAAAGLERLLPGGAAAPASGAGAAAGEAPAAAQAPPAAQAAKAGARAATGAAGGPAAKRVKRASAAVEVIDLCDSP